MAAANSEPRDSSVGPGATLSRSRDRRAEDVGRHFARLEERAVVVSTPEQNGCTRTTDSVSGTLERSQSLAVRWRPERRGMQPSKLGG